MSRVSSRSAEEKCLSSVVFEQIRHEMEEMRSSSKAELLKSWDEIERLEDEKVELKNHNLKLANLLRASMEREEALSRQVEELQQQVRQHTENDRPNLGLLLSANRNSNGSHSARSVCSGISNVTMSTEADDEIPSPTEMPCGEQESEERWNWYVNGTYSLIQAEKERLENEFMLRKQDMEFENQELIENWKTDDENGDEVPQSMEETRQIHIETLEQLLHQLKAHDSRASQREVDHKQQIRTLKKELYSKGKYIIKLNNKMNEYKSYIEDLTSALERIRLSQRPIADMRAQEAAC